MKPIIGIISGVNKSNNLNFNNSYHSIIEKTGGKPINLTFKDDEYISEEILNECDGFLFQGGYKMDDFQLRILAYAYKNKKPILGICLGHQLIATYFSGFGSVNRISDLNNKINIDHYPKLAYKNKSFLAHKIIIAKESYMYPIFGPELMVNSRHIKVVTKVPKPFIISAKSPDGFIEGIEYINQNNYIVGVQFHPEDIDDLKPIFDSFIKRANLAKKFN